MTGVFNRGRLTDLLMLAPTDSLDRLLDLELGSELVAPLTVGVTKLKRVRKMDVRRICT